MAGGWIGGGVEAQIQVDQVRVSGKNRNGLQQRHRVLKQQNFHLPLQFINCRD